jgi:hypothetical protein
MNIYKIDEELRQAESDLMSLVDPETGEILDEVAAEALMERLERLNIDKEKKIEGACFLRREALDTAEIIDNEIKRLQGLKKRQEKRADNLLRYITYALKGEKFKSPFVSVYYKTTESVEASEVPDRYMRIKKEPDKTKIKQALKKGEKVGDARLTVSTSTIINYGRK